MPETTPSLPPPRRTQTQQSIQNKGTLAAAVVGGVFVCVIGWFVLRGGGTKRAQGTEAPPIVAAPPPPGSIDTTPGAGPQVLGSERFHGDMMDRKNPRRKAGELSYLSMDPLEEHRFAVAEPEAWLFLSDGRSVHIRADKGNLYMPDMQKEPEAGTIEGHVLAEAYERREDGKRPQPGADTPIATLRTESLTFDSTLYTASTELPFTIESEAATLNATGLSMAFNEVHERLERLVMNEGELTVRPGARRPESPKQKDAKPARVAAAQNPAPHAPSAPGATGPSAPTGKHAAPKPKPDLETLYHAVFEGNVVAEQAGREVDSEELQLWARLIGNKLPENAFAKLRGEQSQPAHPQPSGAPAAAPRSSGDVARITPAAPTQGARTTNRPTAPASSDAEALTLRWDRTCTILPIEKTPKELEHEQVALRFDSPKAGEVAFADNSQDGKGHAATIDYGATSGTLLLAGEQAKPAAYVLGDGRGIEAGQIQADLAHGLIHIPVPGVLTDQQGRDARITWGSQADFTLEMRDGAITKLLKQAVFEGGFNAAQRDGSLTGGFARADFVAIDNERFALSRLIVQDHAVGESERSGRLAADALDIGFATGSNERTALPRTITATGNASASTGDSRMTAPRIEAQLEEDELPPTPDAPAGAKPRKRPVVAAATASGGVKYEDIKQDVTAEAEELRADFGLDAALHGRRRIVDLTGPAVKLSKGGGGEQSWITGTQVRLDDRDKAMAVFGPGTLDQVQPGVSEVHAAWQGGMTYSGATGLADCSGDATVKAIDYPDKPGDATRRDTLEAGRLKLELVPDAELKSEGLSESERKQHLRRAIAMGSILEREGGTNARITTERLIPDSQSPDGERRIELEYLEGPTIIADNVAQTLDVPAAGRLVVVDRRDERQPSSPGTPPSGGVLGSGDTRGDALFDWAGSFHMDQKAGLMEMHRDVRMTHRGEGSGGRIVNLNADQLSARVAPEQKPASPAAKPGDAAAPLGRGVALRSVTATGAVYATFGLPVAEGEPRPNRQELVADRADYDAATQILTASTNRGGRVTFFDPTKGAPVSADGVRWNLGTGNIEIVHPGEIVGPR